MSSNQPVTIPCPSTAAPAGTEALTSAVCGAAARACGLYRSRMRALVLTGSLAREEGTWVHHPGGWKLLGDAEFLAVFRPGVTLPPPSSIRSMERDVEEALGHEGIQGHIQLTPVHPRFFMELGPRIFAYELRVRGRVVWGEASILSLIPAFAAADILLEDAWRLLANRMIEYLEAAAAVTSFAGPVPQDLAYSTVKLCLDMATSLAVFGGFYAPSYNDRRRRLSALALTSESAQNWPFPLQPFAAQVATATDLKLDVDAQQSAMVTWEFWRQAVQYSKLLWNWELARLAGAPGSAESHDLVRRWMHRQPVGQRLRGWMFVWRACGWLPGVRYWPRWVRLAAGGSPRYRVYDAARTLAEQLPGALESGGQRSADRAVMTRLPVLRRAPDGGWSWSALAHETAWNYHRFLEPTNA